MKGIEDIKISFGKADLSDFAQCSVVTDEHIARLYHVFGDNVYLLPRGEQAKTLENVAALCKWFAERKLSPCDKVVALGGGSVGDTVGFACAIFKRGIQLLHVPTTLVAMVDSSIGGKTAVNFCNVKNMLGTYYFGDVIIDTNFLETLDAEQLNNGMGEILKYRMLDRETDNACRRGESLRELTARCAEYKAEVCRRDPYCQAERNKLNFGHTLGHAMELSLNVAHGVAVANGIYYETELAARLGLCDRSYAETWKEEVRKRFPVYPLTEKMLGLTLQDKKNFGGACGENVGFVLPTDFTLRSIPFSQLTALCD